MLKSARGWAVIDLSNEKELEVLSGKNTSQNEVVEWIQKYPLAKRFARILWKHVLFKQISVRYAQKQLNLMLNYSRPFHCWVIKSLLLQVREKIKKDKETKLKIAIKKFSNHLRVVSFVTVR